MVFKGCIGAICFFKRIFFKVEVTVMILKAQEYKTPSVQRPLYPRTTQYVFLRLTKLFYFQKGLLNDVFKTKAGWSKRVRKDHPTLITTHNATQ